MKPLIAIVGRPNVGKSQLFNRLAGQRIAVVEDLPGTTRDRLYAPCDIWGRACVVIDTGGLEPQEKEGYAPAILSQAQLAIDDADIIIFMTDAREEPTTMDFEVAEKLRQTQKPVILVGNKVDNPKMPLSNLYALRLGDPLPISGLTGHGVGDLADKIDDYLRDNDIAGEEQEKDTSTKIALVGRPNVGKSSITNTLLGYERTIVSPVPGTTRDAIDTRIDWEGNDVTLIDTAGMRRRSRVKRDETSVEYHMVLRSLRAVERADTAVIVLDAGGVTDQDTKIAGYAHEAGKAILIAVNKWDIIEGEREKKTLAQKDYEAQIARYLPFISYAPIHFISAQTGAGVQDMFDDALAISRSLKERVSTGPLNDLLQRAMAEHPPPSPKGKAIKIRYATQVDTMPPTILLFCNRPEIVHFSYVRFLENQIRAKFPFRGVPLKLELRGGSGATGRDERLQAKREAALDEDAERMRQKRAARQGSRAIEQVPATEVPKTTGPKKSARRGAQRFEKANPNGLTSREIKARAPKTAPRQPAKPTPKRRDQQG